MKKFFIRLTLFLILLTPLLIILADKYQEKALEKRRYKPQWALSLKKKTFDFVVLGSSRAENNIDIVSIEEKTGKRGLNAGKSGAALAENYLTLYHLIKNKNTISHVILSIDEWGIIDPDSAYSYPFNDYFFVPYMDDKVTDSVIKDHSNPLKYFIWKYIPFMKFSEFSHIYKFSDFFVEEYNSGLDKTRGTELLPDSTIDSLLYKTYRKKNLTVDHRSVAYLNMLIKLCQDNKINMVFVTTPVHYNCLSILQNRPASIDTIRNIAQKNGIKYFDFVRPDWFEDNMCYNTTHLNKRGAIFFSTVLGDSLNNIF